jgi:polar amino acid transport system permease protein
MVEFTLWDIARNLLLAARWTIALSLIAFVGGGLVGLALVVARIARPASLGLFVQGYVQLFQGTPLLMQLFLAYFGLGLLGINVSPWVAAALALTLYTSAFLAEIWRGSVESVPRGQWEAARALAMSLGEQLRHVIGPQALRVAVPPTVGFLVQVVKGTALASVIGFVELTKAATMITNATFRPFTVYAMVALFYFALCWPISAWSRSLEGSSRMAAEPAAAPSPHAIVRVRALRKRFGANEVLKGIDLDVARGEVICIIGKSGSGRAPCCAASTAWRRSRKARSRSTARRCDTARRPPCASCGSTSA